MAGLTIEQRRRVLDDIVKNGGETVAAQQHQWVVDFSRITETVIREGESASVLPLFWIRLHGVLTELPDQLAAKLDTINRIIGPGCSLPQDVMAVERSHRACVMVRGALDEDELIYADYRRQVEVHVCQRGYRLGVNKGNCATGLRETYTVASLRKKHSVDELDRRIVALLRRYRVNEQALGVAIARKVEASVASLLAAMSASHGEPR